MLAFHAHCLRVAETVCVGWGYRDVEDWLPGRLLDVCEDIAGVKARQRLETIDTVIAFAASITSEKFEESELASTIVRLFKLSMGPIGGAIDG